MGTAEVSPRFFGTGIHLLRSLGVLVSVFALAACASGPMNPFSGPLGEREGASSTMHRVRFEVLCYGCAISWQVGAEGGSLSESGGWSRSVRVMSHLGEAYATLTATTHPGARRVAWVRIRVDGKVAAEAVNEDVPFPNDQNTQRTLHVGTRVPPLGGS